MPFHGDSDSEDDGPVGDINPDGDDHDDDIHRHHGRHNHGQHEKKHGHHHHHHHREGGRKGEKTKLAVVQKASTVHHFGEDEGLGEDFRDTAWKEPSKELALKFLAERRFGKAGKDNVIKKASIWGTGIEDLNVMGTGVGGYFLLVKAWTKMMFVSSILSLPHLVFAHYGNYGEEAFATKDNSDYIFFQHSAGHHAYVDPQKFQKEYCGSDEYGYNVDTLFEADVDCSTEWLYRIPLLNTIGMSTDLIRARHASMIIVVCDVVNSVCIVIFIFIMKLKLGWMVSKHNATACDVSSYAVFVKGLPNDATQEQIIDHFSTLYTLDGTVRDWEHPGTCCGCIGRKSSRHPGQILFPSGERGLKPLKPVQPGAALNAEKPILYDGKWVAEVEVVHPMDTFLRTMQRNAVKSRKLLVDRARVKKCKMFQNSFGGQKLLQVAEERLAKTEKSIEKTKQKLHGMKKMMNNMENVCVGAFVVFNHEESFKRCLKDYSRKSFLHRQCFGQHKPLRFRGESTLHVTAADKPGNILWENINIQPCEARLRRLFGTFIAFVCLVISFLLIFYASMTEQSMAKDLPSTEMCEEYIPAAYTMTKSATWTYEKDMCSDPNQYYISFEETQSGYRDATLVDDCVAPCISSTDDWKHDCPDLLERSKEYTYSPQDVFNCYCIDKMSTLIEEKGFYEGPEELANDEVCGEFASKYSTVQSLTLAATFAVPFVNELLKKAIAAIGNFQRYKTTTERSISVSINTFYAVYFNTALLLLLVNGKIRIFANAHLNEENDLASTDYDELWYSSVGLAITNIMAYNIFIPHLAPFAKSLLNPIRRWYHGDGLTQMQLNEFYLTDKFEMEQKCAQLMQTLAVTLTFSAGMPALYPIAFVTLLVMYWLDKYFLLRVDTKPRVVQGQLGKELLKLMPYMVLVHLANGFWMYSYRPSQGYQGQEGNKNPELDGGGQGNIGGVFDAELYFDDPDYYNKFVEDGVGGLYPTVTGSLAIRLNRVHVVPIFVVFMVLGIYFLVLGRILGIILWVLTKCGCCSKKDAGKALASQRQFNPPLTQNYMKQLKEKWSMKQKKWVVRKPPTLDGKLGWRVYETHGELKKEWSVEQNRWVKRHPKLPDQHSFICKYKDAKNQEKTWEVIKHTGLYTYQMRYNDAYTDIFIAYDQLLGDKSCAKDEETGDMPPPGASKKVVPVMP